MLDYSHCSLQQVPKEIFSFERTLEELYLDANQIEELPKVGSAGAEAGDRAEPGAGTEGGDEAGDKAGAGVGFEAGAGK